MSSIQVPVPRGLDPQTARHVVQQLLDHQALLTRVSKALADEHTPIGPGVLAQLGRVDRMWRSVEDTYGLLTREQVTQITGGNPEKAKSHVTNLRRRSGLLGVVREGALRFPGFQISRGRVRQDWSTLTGQLLAAGWNESDVLLWFVAPTGWLDGQAPAELLDAEPEAVARAVGEVAKGPAA